MSSNGLILLLLTTVCHTLEIFHKFEPSMCKSSEYFNVNSLKCIECDSSKFLVPSADKLSCSCDNRSIIQGWNGNLLPKCVRCLNDKMPSADLRFCISYDNVSDPSRTLKACFENDILVERELNGAPMAKQACIKCIEGTRASQDRAKCIPCHWSMYNCTCPSGTHEMVKSLCVPKYIFAHWPRGSENYEIAYDKISIDSKFFRDNLQASLFKCKMNESVSCQAVSNMCVLNMYQDNHQGGPCRLVSEFGKSSAENRKLQWIYYGEADAVTVLNERKIAHKFTMDPESEDSSIKIKLYRWALNGTWLGMVDGLSVLQLCPMQSKITGIRFAGYYKNMCYISSKQLLYLENNEFYDAYIMYKHRNESVLQGVPVLNLNYRRHNKFINKGGDMSQWQLTKRLFLVESIGGHRFGDNDFRYPLVMHFLKSVTLRLRVRNGEDEGKIFPPLLVISYGEITREDIENNIPVKLTFNVEFLMNNNIKHSVDVALGVLCSLSVIWSCIRSWCHAHRSGQRTIDIITILNLLIISCGHLANVFFLVVAGAAIHSFVYYKGETVAHVLLPSEEFKYLVCTYVIVAFPLKMCEVFAMVWHQVKVDIFLVDWEQPRVKSQTNLSVSAWRTYFVANEWNEVQTVRKTSLMFQLASTIFLLKVCGFENWALCEPELHTSVDPSELHFTHDIVFRFAVAVIVFCTIYIIQWMFMVGFYERYIKNPIQEFVDVCSLANISVFILSLQNFGYYIHGRSAHGFSDTDMGTLRNQLQREAEDLVGHRGLVPASDHQTFQLLIPPQLRCIYTSLLKTLPEESNRFGVSSSRKSKGKLSGAGLDHLMKSYVSMNRFLAAFIEHALKDLDYEVKDKSFCEALLDIELYDFRTRGVLFYDNGHSFDNILYYGNEFTLFSFDLIVFCFIDVLFQDFILATILTGCCSKVIACVRQIGGRKNLAQKTLIDEHFLI